MVKRAAHGAILIVAVVILDFFLLHLAPGSIAQALASASGGATPAMLAAIRHEYGLNKPLYIQLYIYIVQILHGNLGKSFYYNQSVISLVGQRLPATLLLILSAQGWSILIGTLMGVLASTKPRGIRSSVVTVLAMLGFATPAFWLGIMLLIVFAYMVPIFPASGMMSIDDIGAPLLVQVGNIARHLVLPSFTLGFIYLANYSRLARSSMIETLQQDYIRTARAKGVSNSRVILVHALRNALLPVVTVGGLQFSQVIAGAVLVETVFNWPGMGLLAYHAILRRDYTVILGILVIASIVVVVMNFVTDLAYYWLDPRIR
jgi:peptide/nickel transport system permease protein